MKFKVGDTVKITGNRGQIHHYYSAGETGIVVERRTGRFNRYEVESFSRKDTSMYIQVIDEIDLELLAPIPTTNQSALVFLKK